MHTSVWPVLMWLAFELIGLGYVLSKHGEPRTDNYNFFTTFAAVVITTLILAWGGFFAPLFR